MNVGPFTDKYFEQTTMVYEEVRDCLIERANWLSKRLRDGAGGPGREKAVRNEFNFLCNLLEAMGVVISDHVVCPEE